MMRSQISGGSVFIEVAYETVYSVCVQQSNIYNDAPVFAEVGVHPMATMEEKMAA